MDSLMHSISWTIVHSLWLALLCWAVVQSVNSVIRPAKTRKLIRLSGLFLFLILLACLVPSAPTLSPGDTLQFIRINEFELSRSSDWITMVTDWVNGHSRLIGLGWLLGAGLAIIRLCQSHKVMKRLGLGAIICTDTRLITQVNTLRLQMGITQKVILKVSSLVNSPMCIGFVKPVIYLPLGLSNGLREDELDAIIQHELAHIKHGDFIINYALVLLETAFFFNPMVLHMVKELRQEMEYACDDVVTKNQSGITYSRALLKLQELQLNRAWAWLRIIKIHNSKNASIA